MIRRLVGVDLGIASAHTVRVLAEDGREVCRRRCEPTVDSLSRVETAALAGDTGGHGVGGGDGADRTGVVADGGVLHRPRAPGVPGVQRESR